MKCGLAISEERRRQGSCWFASASVFCFYALPIAFVPARIICTQCLDWLYDWKGSW